MKKRLLFVSMLLMGLVICAAAFAAEEYTVSFEKNGGTDAFDLVWSDHTQYPTAYPMEPVTVAAGEPYTIPECSMVPPDWEMFDHWIANGKTDPLAPGDVITVEEDTVLTPVWTARTFTAAFEIGTLTQGQDDPPSFFVSNFLVPYFPADMVPYNARGNKNPYERNIRIYWYRIEDGARSELVSSIVFADPDDAAPGGMYFQALAPGEPGDYETVITYKGQEVLSQYWTMLPAGMQEGGHEYQLNEILSKDYDGEPVSFDPGDAIIVDGGKTRWAVLEKNGEAQYIWREYLEKTGAYRNMEGIPTEIGRYQLVIREMDGKDWVDAAGFEFEIADASAAGSMELLLRGEEDVNCYIGMPGNGMLAQGGEVWQDSMIVNVWVKETVADYYATNYPGTRPEWKIRQVSGTELPIDSWTQEWGKAARYFRAELTEIPDTEGEAVFELTCRWNGRTAAKTITVHCVDIEWPTGLTGIEDTIHTYVGAKVSVRPEIAPAGWEVPGHPQLRWGFDDEADEFAILVPTKKDESEDPYQDINDRNELRIVRTGTFESTYVIASDRVSVGRLVTFEIDEHPNWDFILPDDIQSVGPGAFENVSAETVYIPDGCKSIAAGAFADSGISVIRIPASVTEIGENALPQDVFIYTTDGSYVIGWAEEHGFEDYQVVY